MTSRIFSRIEAVGIQHTGGPGAQRGRGGGVMSEGYHVLGHCILESWEALVKAGADAGAMSSPDVIGRAVRDIGLLVGLLDGDVAIMAGLIRIYSIGRPEEIATSPEKQEPLASPEDGTAKAAAGSSTSIWPSGEFSSMGALAEYVHRQFAINMTEVLKEAGKPGRRLPMLKLTIHEAKAAVESLLRKREEKTQE